MTIKSRLRTAVLSTIALLCLWLVCAGFGLFKTNEAVRASEDAAVLLSSLQELRILSLEYDNAPSARGERQWEAQYTRVQRQASRFAPLPDEVRDALDSAAKLFSQLKLQRVQDSAPLASRLRKHLSISLQIESQRVIDWSQSIATHTRYLFLTQLRVYSIVTLGILILVACITSVIIICTGKRILHSVTLLQNGAARIAGGEFGVTLEITGNDEIAELGQTFNRMSGELSNSYAELSHQAALLEMEIAERQAVQDELVANQSQLETLYAEQRATQEELRQRETEIQSLFMAAPVGIAYVKDRIFHKVNEAICDLYGYSREELLGQDTRLIYPSDSEYDALGAAAYGQAQEQGVTMTEAVTINRSGERIEILLGSAPLVKGDASSGFVNMILDITQRKQMENRLKESEMRFQAIFQESPIVIALNELQGGTFLDVNPTFCQMSGKHKEEVIGKTPLEVGVVSIEESARHIGIMRANGKIVQEEITSIKADGSPRFSLLDTRIIQVGDSTCALTMLQDISERKHHELALAASEQRFRTLIEEAPICVSMVRDGRYIYSNRLHAQTFGFASPDEVVGFSRVEMIAPHGWDALTEYGRKLEQGEVKSVQFETTGLRKDGTEFPYNVTATQIQLTDGTVLLSFGTDVTERKKARDLMVQSEKMAMIAGMAAGMGHEVNNPLGIISQDLQNLERRFSPELPANLQVAASLGLDLDLVDAYMHQRDITAYLESMRRAVGRASSIISNMLKFSRQSNASHQLADLNETVELAIKLASNDFDLRKNYDFRNMTVSKEFGTGLPRLMINITEIEQVLINLLKNAAQAMFEARTPAPSITIGTKASDTFVVLTVRDNGPGMSEEVRNRVFDPFFTTKDVGSGTGLGLSVSHAIITKNHGGQISVGSVPGQGACFTIQFPIPDSAA
jgi:PAS domain S-box-containing protein